MKTPQQIIKEIVDNEISNLRQFICSETCTHPFCSSLQKRIKELNKVHIHLKELKDLINQNK